MKNPQELAKRLYDHFSTPALYEIKENGCCAFVLMWALGLELSDIEAVMLVDDLIHQKALKDDCTVKWAEAVKALTGKPMKSVDFIDCKTIGNIKERTPVRYDYNGRSHWVGVENGKVAFNPLVYSSCVEFGRPATKRIIKIK